MSLTTPPPGGIEKKPFGWDGNNSPKKFHTLRNIQWLFDVPGNDNKEILANARIRFNIPQDVSAIEALRILEEKVRVNVEEGLSDLANPRLPGKIVQPGENSEPDDIDLEAQGQIHHHILITAKVILELAGKTDEEIIANARIKFQIPNSENDRSVINRVFDELQEYSISL